MKYNYLGICRSLLQHVQDTMYFFSIVPAPTTVTTANISNLIIFAGSLLTLTCTVTLDETLGSVIGDLSVASVWTGPNGAVPTGGHIVISETTKNDISYSSFVGFNTVHTDDAGDYTCTATVSPSVPSNMVMNGVGSSDPVNFSVDGKIVKVFHLVYEVWFFPTAPTITVSLEPNTTRLLTVPPYNTIAITCTATAPEGVVAGKTISWRRRIGPSTTDLTEITDNGDTIRIVTTGFNQPETISVLTVTETTPGDYRYRCRVDIPEIGINDVDGDVYPIDVIGKFQV